MYMISYMIKIHITNLFIKKPIDGFHVTSNDDVCFDFVSGRQENVGAGWRLV